MKGLIGVSLRDVVGKSGKIKPWIYHQDIESGRTGKAKGGGKRRENRLDEAVVDWWILKIYIASTRYIQHRAPDIDNVRYLIVGKSNWRRGSSWRWQEECSEA